MGEMRRIPGGMFRQGTAPWVLDWLDAADQPLPRLWFADETPQVTTVVAPFRIDRFPVTVGEYARFVRDTGYRTDAERRGFGLVYTEQGWAERAGVTWRAPGGPGTESRDFDDHPVVHVSWNDANEFAAWCGRRLPTEAEWEFAARGPDFRVWPWGDEWDVEAANTAELHAGPLTSLPAWQQWWRAECGRHGPVPRTSPVGSFSERGDSPFGCADMAGNVYEWTATVSRLYDDTVRCDPTVRMAMGRYRVIRGGSWMNFRYQVRCSERMHGDPQGWSSFAHGFRCAADA
ncbi:formylglycine-generating enzyme family protein [Micromonospora narathiwatensis]|uniref:Formylglycine-generating enzyme, required for sulfatase activity, contains SUMF1/FGE domain n=1 Tax=Micromonospora narathiwatensis TaxID=299146 RepID=A0A1A8ZS61_9ACTN|nr:SUMF1/EgtB/PvdO family nonheme iron enzyme [Micromonospora narathiwatensis]SBT46722.1 Formylglycine-generating enzyme, required for sulfatase activity, contains SUMF1/FGE domain [Micromonospora narathiwatensis]